MYRAWSKEDRTKKGDTWNKKLIFLQFILLVNLIHYLTYKFDHPLYIKMKDCKKFKIFDFIQL